MRRERQRQKLLRTLVSFLLVETSIFFWFLFCDLLDRFEAEQKAKALSTPSLFAIAVTVSFLSWKHKIGYGGLASELRCCVEAVSTNQRTTISYVTQEPAAAHAPIMMFGCL